jgi:branched-chain amino acid transport system ATP-binding protein
MADGAAPHAAARGPSTPLLDCRDVAVSYGAVQALRGIDLSVRHGTVHVLLGANGAGKSTLLAAISGLVALRAGTVCFDGASLAGLDPRAIVRRGIAHCPEGRRLFGALTVAENLRLGAAGRADATGADADRDALLALFPILRERLGQAAGTLSGGEQQQLALARALMAKPRLLLLDEPSLGVAPKLVAQIFETLLELRRRGTTILLVEQNVRAAAAIADDATLLASGRVRFAGRAAQLDTDALVGAVLGGGDTGRPAARPADTAAA